MSNIGRKLEKTCQNARERGNQRELAQALEELACYLADQRDWDHLVQVRTELLQVLEKIKDNLELARCHRLVDLDSSAFSDLIRGISRSAFNVPRRL